MKLGPSVIDRVDTNLEPPKLSRELVHKARSENVFIEKIERVARDEFVSTSSFPLHHVAYNDSESGLSAACYLVEVARQANLAICHQFFDVPLDAGFLIASIDWNFTDGVPYAPGFVGPFALHTRVVETGMRRGQLAKIVIQGRYYDAAGNEFLNGGASFVISARKLNTSKKEAAPVLRAALLPEEVQVATPINVLIGTERDEDGRHPMVVNTEHPYFFEHRNDHHVPGMMLLEAGKQAAVYNAAHKYPLLEDTYGDSLSGEITFGRFASLASPVWISCEVGELSKAESGCVVPIDVHFEQGSRRIGKIAGTFGFVDHAVIEARSEVRRHQLELLLAGAPANIPMNGAFQ